MTIRRLLLFVLWMCSALVAQDEVPTEVTVQNRTGDLPFSSSFGSDVDQVDVSSGSLRVTIPIFSTPGRNGQDFTYVIRYDSRMFTAGPREDAGGQLVAWNVSARNYIVTNGLGWTTNEPYVTSTTHQVPCVHQAIGAVWADHYVRYRGTVIFSDSNGSKHEFLINDQGGECYWGPTGYFYSNHDSFDFSGQAMRYAGDYRTALASIVDGTGSKLLIGGDTSFDSGNSFGTLGSVYAGWTDSDGNTIHRWPGEKDTLGRIPLTRSTAGNQVTYSFRDANGDLQSAVLTFTDQLVTTTFQYMAGGQQQYAPNYSGTRRVLSSVVLPGNRTYSFVYDSQGTITQMTMPTGAVVNYAWANTAETRRVTSRTVTADGQSNTSTLSMPAGSRGSNDVILHNPDGNEVKYHFTDDRVELASFFEGAASGTPLKTIAIGYTSWTAVDGKRTLENFQPSVFTTTIGGLVSKKEFTYDSYTATEWSCADESSCEETTGPIQTEYTNTFGNVKEIREYGFGLNAVGPLLRRTVKEYLHEANATYPNPNYAAYYAANILNRVTREAVYDARGTADPADDVLISETLYEYDGNALVDTAGAAAAHDYVNYPNSFTLRGNVTKVKRWLREENRYLTTEYVYDDLGNIRSIKSPMQVANAALGQSSWDYTDNFQQAACPPVNGAGLIFPTTFTNAKSFQVKFSYKSCSGQIATHQDQNELNSGNLGTRYSYDLLNRPTRKDLADGGYTRWDYAADLTWKGTHVLHAGSTEFDSKEEFDQLGRTKRTRLQTTAYDVLTDTFYEPGGKVWKVSNPYVNSTEPTYGLTETVYDGLGRVRKVIPPDGSASTNNVSTDYSVDTTNLLECTTVTDQALHARKSCNDAFGRLVGVEEPGDSFNPSIPGTPATGSTGAFTIQGSEQSVALPAVNAVAASGSVSISGHGSVGNSGLISVTVGSTTRTASYSSSTTSSALATTIKNGFSTSTVVTATVSGSSVIFTAKTAGTAGNSIALSASVSQDTGTPPFSVSTSGSTLTGGVNAQPAQTVYDAGTVALTVGSESHSKTFGSGSTAATIASDLASAFAGSPNVTISVSGATLNLTSVGTGNAVNYSLSSSSTYDTAHFSAASFTATRSGATMTGGVNAQPGVEGAGNGVFSMSTPYVTLYEYDLLGNLMRVEQRGYGNGATSTWRLRSFTYDSLGRLLTADNPESGHIVYAYDDDGNVIAKTSPAPNQTGTARLTINYAYDKVHRLTGKTYSNGEPGVTYSYDDTSYNGLTIANGIGRRTGMTDASGQTAWTYDLMGRAVKERRTIAGITKELTYEFNPDGSEKKLTYPSGAMIEFAYDPFGRMLSALDAANNINYARDALYTPSGALSGLTLGNSTNFTGFHLANSYNNRLQPAILSADKPGGTIFSRTYGYGTLNNGNIASITDNITADRSVSFSYDALNRILSAQSAGTDCSPVPTNPALTQNWGNTYTIDAWGNLTAKTVTKCSSESLSTTANVKNQLAVGGHDAAGNLMNYGSATYVYDAENRINTTAGATYVYDGDGVRVKKSGGSAPATLYWGESFTAGPIVETDLSGAIKAEYVYFGGKRVARRDYPCASAPDQCVHYYFSDHLNSTNLVYSASGVREEESDFYPYGGERAIVGGSGNHFKFTGKERDQESGLDYFGARYYGNSLGRFLTADWAPTAIAVPYAQFGNPQTLNLYSYVGNHPITQSDVDGHCWPPGECARQLMHAVDKAQKWAENKAIASGNPAVAAAVTYYTGTARDVVNGTVGLGTVGEASGRVWDSGNTTQRVLAAVEDGGKAGGIALTLAPAGGALASKLGSKTTVAQDLQGAANRALDAVGPGKGAVHGTAVHSEFASQVEGLGNRTLTTEQSYLNGKPADYGTKGSIRVDVAEGPIDAPTAVYDLKTGNATLTPQRIAEIQSHLPGGTSVPVLQIKPFKR